MNRRESVAYTSASLTRLAECANLTDSRDPVGLLFSYCDAAVLSCCPMPRGSATYPF